MTTLDLSLDSVTVRVAGRTIEFYPLNFRALRQLGKELEELRKPAANGVPSPERFDAICRLLVASANRREQVITEEQALDMFDPSWADQILEAVNKLSGLRRASSDDSLEDTRRMVAAGAPLIPTSPQTGGESTPQ